MQQQGFLYDGFYVIAHNSYCWDGYNNILVKLCLHQSRELLEEWHSHYQPQSLIVEYNLWIM